MEQPLRASLLILWFQLVWVSGQDKVEQIPLSLKIREGENGTMICNYTIRNFYSLQWYRQYAGKGLEFLLLLSSSGNKKQVGRLAADLNIEERISSLLIRDSQAEDSATYLCARGSGSDYGKLLFGTGTKLTVNPNVTNPQPRMYHLKKPRVNDLSVCLFTDFGNEEVNMMGINNIKRTPSMVAEKRLASMSLGIVAWNNNLDWKCQAEVSNITYSLSNSSGKVCNTTAVTENFSSDPYLNSINLAMIFLRVIFVKTVGFNLLMTLKLWSS